jgi:hypothetical protein
VLSFGVTGIELMLVKNQITDVDSIYSTGQLIPVIVGVGAVFKLLGRFATRKFVRPELIWSFLVSLYDILQR